MRPALGLALLLTACGGPADGGRATRSGADAQGEGPCGPHEANLAGTCWSAEGTRWNVEAEGPGGVYRFDVELLAAGRVRSSDHGAASPARDEWFQDGELLRVFLADRFVEYRAEISNGTVLIGEAMNVRGQQWSWRGDRVFGEAPCADSEARVDGACMTVAGTRWRLAAEGSEARLIEFLEDGRVGIGGRADDLADDPADDLADDPTDDPTDNTEAPGRWEQDGSTLRFTLGAGSPAYVAEVAGDAELRGTRDDERAFEATRVPSVPPVIHR